MRTLSLIILAVGFLFARDLPATTASAPDADGTGHIPVLSWQQRSDWVSVVDHGATGDGAADDTTAIQSVLDAAKDGATIYFPPGTYRITRMLSLEGPLLGVLVVGHGRDTRLIWDGRKGGRMFRDDGVAYSRITGLVFDGRNRAAVGFYHDSNLRFETEVRHQHLAFLNFTEAGILAEPKDKYALSEPSFENCLFVNCRSGVKFIQFNDYNFTFDGCEFRDSEIAIECRHGNFYVRNCRFERSREVDIYAEPEHHSSVRRCVSSGSERFIEFTSPAAPLTIQDCLVTGWRNRSDAIYLRGAPVTVFDCHFSDPPNSKPPICAPKGGQRLVLSENTSEGTSGLVDAARSARIHRVPAGRRGGIHLAADRSFLKSSVAVPGKILDAKKDFGARGDGVSDDSAAIQACIDAARGHGRNAIAYLPIGDYVLKSTLRIEGENYVVGGCGWQTRFLWQGAAEAVMISVRPSGKLAIEHMAVRNIAKEPLQNGVDIQQDGSGGPSHVTYDGVFVYGLYKDDPFRKGLHLSGLGPEDTVLMPHLQGNIRLTDCAAATVLANISYEGAITVEGKDPPRDGFLGFLSRLSTNNRQNLYLKDNHSIVMTDFYVEQSTNGLFFAGDPQAPPGRATIQSTKLSCHAPVDNTAEGVALTIEDYHGEIFLGNEQFYISPVAMRVRHSGGSPVNLHVFSSTFYRTHLTVDGEDSLGVHLIGNEVFGRIPAPERAHRNFQAEDSSPAALEPLSRALDDVRRLGELDLRLNHPPGS